MSVVRAHGMTTGLFALACRPCAAQREGCSSGRAAVRTLHVFGVLGGASGAACACVVERHGSTWMGMLVACVARIGYVVHRCS